MAQVAVNEAGQMPDSLLAGLVDNLVNLGMIRTDRVERAFRAVPRHQFLPDVELANAYEDTAVVTKRDELGVAISSVSAPHIVAVMLEQLDVQPGHRVLEIGSGGYNAALLSELVGPTGSVTSIDIDHEVTSRACQCLTATGYDNVNVLCTDGEFGAPEHAPYDRVIVTVGAWDLPPAWVDQLAEGGRIVVPIRMRGLTRSVCFERDNGRLIGRNYEMCGFVPMQGVGECREQVVPLDGELVGLRVDDGQHVNADALRDALRQPRTETWSELKMGPGERVDGLHLWLALNLPKFCVLAAKQEAVDRGIVAHAWPIGVPTAVNDTSFAYLTFRPTTPEKQQFAFGAYGHGPQGEQLAKEIVRHIETWDGESLTARINAHPAETPDAQLPSGALVLDKRHIRLTVSWLSKD